MHSEIVPVMVMSGVTILLRSLPFVLLRNQKTPKFIAYLGEVLPYAIMGMLVVYCLKGVNVFSRKHGIPELVAGILVVVSYVWKKNSLISIVLGTVVYMFLVQI